jgi:hypothetical protein
MQLKDESRTDARAKFHLRRKLSKALHHAMHLLTLCNAKSDKKTILEAEAYSSWMNANYLLEKEDWKQALDHFLKSRYSPFTYFILYNSLLNYLLYSLQFIHSLYFCINRSTPYTLLQRTSVLSLNHLSITFFTLYNLLIALHIISIALY